MRVVKNIEKEEYITCPECKMLLAYTQNDIRQSFRFVNDTKLLKVSNYIDCPVCGYSNWINYQEYNFNR